MSWSFRSTTASIASPGGPLGVEPGDPEVIYSGTGVFGVYRWVGEDAGGFVNSGLLNLMAPSFATDPLSPGTVYVGTFGGGVYRLDRR